MKKLLIVVAINEELKLLKSCLLNKKLVRQKPDPLWEGTLNGYPVEVLMTSLGTTRAHTAVRAAINPLVHGGVFIAGFCGGLSLALRVGDAAVASKVLSADGRDSFNLDLELCEELGRALISDGIVYRVVPFTTQDRVIEKPDDKKNLFDNTGAEAVDMESSEVIRAASERDVRVCAVKVIVDDVETELPPFNEYLERDGKLDHLNVRQILMNHPALALRLRQFMRRGAAVLQKSLPQMVSVACTHWKIEKVQ